jgi:lambda family phage portal protein
MADDIGAITVPGIPGSAAATLYPGLESFPQNAYLFPTLMTAHEEVQISRYEAVRQARQAERQSETIRGGIDRKVNTVVGADLFPRLMPDYETLGQTPEWAADFARQGEALFKSWAIDRRKIADAEGHLTFGGLMWMAARNLAGPDGETFGIIHYDVLRQRRLGTPWATTVTVLDPQRVDTPPEYSGNPNVVDGKLLDDYGRMLGFYFNKMPRGPGMAMDLTFGFCPRENTVGRPMGWHYFAKHRGAMQRGITSLINILKRTRMLDKFDGAQLGAAIVAAAMATYVKTKSSPEEARENLAPPGAETLPERAMAGRFGFYDQLKLRIGPQRIPVLPLDDEIHIEAADRSATDPTMFRAGFLREFASALNITAEQLSLDYSNVNYSSARAALVDIWRGVIVERSLFCSSVPSLVLDAVLEECVVKGWLKLPDGAPPFNQEREAYTRCAWTGPAMGWVDPMKEAQAAALRTNPSAPLSTLTREAAAQGISFDELVAERTREQQTLLRAGLITSIAPAPPPTAGGNAGSAGADNAPPDPPPANENRRGEP